MSFGQLLYTFTKTLYICIIAQAWPLNAFSARPSQCTLGALLQMSSKCFISHFLSLYCCTELACECIIANMPLNALLHICLLNALQFITIHYTSNLNALLHRLSQCTIADNVMYYNSLQAISMHYCIDPPNALMQGRLNASLKIPSQCIIVQTRPIVYAFSMHYYKQSQCIIA